MSLKTSSTRCRTKYPIVLVHGHGWRDDKFVSYWGRIPKRLSENGAKLYYGNGDGYARIETNARMLKASVKKALKDSGAEKVNLLAHSKGGVECRDMITRLGMGPCVASLTTISTTHHGSHTVDIGLMFPHVIFKIVGVFVDLYWGMVGDKHPDFYGSTVEMSRKWCTNFNAKTPDYPGVYYQSYAACMKYPFSDPFFFWNNIVVRLFDGPNDGLVSVESAKWGEFKGKLMGKYIRGLSHADTVDLYRISTPGLDVPELYCKIAEELKKIGY
jgi:triacylglycerol lipase